MHSYIQIQYKYNVIKKIRGRLLLFETYCFFSPLTLNVGFDREGTNRKPAETTRYSHEAIKTSFFFCVDPSCLPCKDAGLASFLSEVIVIKSGLGALDWEQPAELVMSGGNPENTGRLQLQAAGFEERLHVCRT